MRERHREPRRARTECAETDDDRRLTGAESRRREWQGDRNKHYGQLLCDSRSQAPCIQKAAKMHEPRTKSAR